MRQPRDIAREEADMATLVKLTSSFEGIASMRISQIKDQVVQSTQFFNELWGIYSQINVDERFQFGRGKKSGDVIDKELYIVVTAEGGFSGDIDQKLVERMMSEYDPEKQDVVVVGSHGAAQLAQRSVRFKKYFKMPSKDQNINVTPVVREIQLYRSTKLYYQEYLSLMRQEVKSIELSKAVQERGDASRGGDQMINEQTYIFEPSTYAVVAHLERSMMQIAVSQLILESKLAQYAARFRAMSVSHERATDARDELHLAYNRARRNVKDERLKEIINGLKKARAGARA